jgi:hypothetical protein
MTPAAAAPRPLLLAALGVAICLVPSAARGQAAPAPSSPAAANPFGRKYPARVYTTARLQGKPPAIDGRLDDEAWQQGAWAGDYTQFMPVEGASPSQPTELKILYDDTHVYIAIRAYDDPAKVHRYPGRRDDFNNYAVDVVGVCFDSYNDKRTGFEFDLTAGGGKIDLILGNGEDEWDTTWDAVWDGEVAHDEKGWSAEFRIPLNQLRYGTQQEQVWGLHAWRWIARNHEEDQWQLIPRQNTGRMYQLGELRGIGGLPRSRHVEVLPHVLGKASSGPSVSDGGTDGAGSAGLDSKIGLASNFTLDATVNPDFGQVEADPSVMNLTAFETFYEEKRPFFLEGRKLLTFELEGDDQLFYSRRIGEAPSYLPPLAAYESARLPESTTILGAFKLTGRTSGGLSAAALQGFTQKETVGISAPSGTRTAVVEPFASYTIGRLRKDWNAGNTSLGGMITSSHRWIGDASLAFLPTQASSGGIDFTRYFGNRSWVLDASGAFSRVTGDPAAILALQTNPVHYFQRPDASHLGVDAGRTSLAGHSGSARFGRSDASRLRLTDHVHWYSPGFDLNDVGYLRQADVIANQVFLGWSEPTPRSVFRSYSVQLSREDNWDFGGLQTAGTTAAEASAEFANKWTASAVLAFARPVDTRALRGGPALRESDVSSSSFGIGTDSARRVSLSVSGTRERALDAGTGFWGAGSRLRLRPSNRLLLTVDGHYRRGTDDLQYVTTAQTESGSRWVLGRIDQEVWNLTVRANLSLTPELTVQYYGSPFIATGRYMNFKKATDTLAANYEDRFHRFAESEISYNVETGRYEVAEAGGGPGSTYSFANPDFSFRQFRSNLVGRWEYKPGSTLYLVWSQGRTDELPAWESALGGHWSALWRARPDNVFLVKASYWFSL